MWKSLRLGGRRRTADQQALKEALAEPLPLGAADIPLDVPLAPWASRARAAAYFTSAAFSFLTYHLVLGLELNLAIILLLAGEILIALAGGLPELSGLNRRVYVSAEGIRLERIFGSVAVPWWEVGSVQAKPDLSAIRVLRTARWLTLDNRGLPIQKRKEILIAIRARLPASVEIEEWPKEVQILRRAFSAALHGAGAGLVIAGFATGALTAGNVLGLRCSVNSAFLERTFGTPDRQGCVVLRVSAGAEEAGIRRGDLVIEMEGYPVTSGRQFSLVFEESDPPWDFTVIRRGEPRHLRFKVSGGRGKNFREEANDPFFYYLRARWDAAEKPDQAINDYGRAIELEPDFDLAYLYRGQLYEERSDREAASRDYLKALELGPRLGEAHAIYAYFIDNEDPGAALEHINLAVELDHCSGAFETYNIDCSSSYLLLASLHADQAAEMAAMAEQAIRFYDGFADNYFNAMCAYSILGDAIRAQAYARRYLKFSPEEREPDRTELARRVRDGRGVCS